jgi:Uma2 family endonuclease
MSVVESTPPKVSEPAWEIAMLFPNQGSWTEGDYLSLTDNARHLVELVDGRVEVLPMPTESHQNIVWFVVAMLKAFVNPRKLGRVVQSPFRVRVAASQFREPDISLMLRENDARRSDEYWDGADLVIEVVSDDPKDRLRDFEIKREVYAKAGIREYWIIDQRDSRILVLKLAGDIYLEHADAAAGGRVGSNLLAGFELDVDAVLASAESED